MKKFIFNKKNLHRAFSLLELVLYVGILSGLMVTSSNMFISLSKGNGQTQARSEVNAAIRFATERIKQDIKNSSSISTPELNVSSPSLSMTINNVTVVYDVSSGVLRRKEGTADPAPITPPNISVDSPIFTRIENTNTIFNLTTTTIQINMMFRYNSANPDWTYSSQLQTTVTVTADSSSTYVGTYTYPTYTLSVTKDGTGTGTVTSSPSGINCGGSCSYDFPQGANSYVTLTTSTDGTFTGWSDGCTGPGQCVVAMDAAKNVNATFTVVVPTLTTTTVSSIAQTIATGGGNITSSGGASVTAKGVVWDTSPNPTTALSTKTSDGIGVGSFSSSITGLSANTLYHIRAYATNSAGTSYGSDETFTTLAYVPTLTTTSPVTDITQSSATGGGNISSNGGATVTARGVVWNTLSDPTIALSTKTSDGSGNGSFTSSITGLSISTLYHVRAYATNSAGTAYGSDVTFTTSDPVVPTLTTISPVTNITETTASGSGNISSNGGAIVTVSGLVWGTSLNPTTALSTKTTDGWAIGGPWTSIQDMTGLTPGTLYHYRAYATNSAGTAYGSDVTFTTLKVPTLTTPTSASITQTTVTLGANVTDLGNPASISARGVCYGTSPNPTTPCVAEGATTTGVFTKGVTGLTASTTYYYRGYATNSTGTGYSSDGTFTTSDPVVPTLTTTDPVTSIATSSATGGGNISSNGGATVTVSGLVWNTSSNPTTALSTKTTDGWAIGGPWTSSMTGLTPDTLYHVRAYATNSVGTAYGADVTFTTLALSVPTVTTPTSASVATTSATLGATVSSLGVPASISARGTCYATTANPTTNCVAEGGTSTGAFNHSRTGLTAGTSYYYRGYATNSTGTAYSADGTFTTLTTPTLTTTDPVTSVAQTTATGGGNISSNGGATVTVSGLVWNTSSNPTTALSTKTTDGWAIGGPWTSSMTGLTCNILYYVRAYATNSVGTSYGSNVTFTSSACSPTVTTTSISSIAQTTASSGGNVTADGGATVTARGVAWNTAGTPTISGSHTSDGTGTGSFTSSITGLTCNTAYHVRAYATNSAGTSYGSEVDFTSSACNVIPTVTTPSSDSVTATTATLGATVTSLGVPNSISRGTCYATTANPTTNCLAEGGTTASAFTHSRTGLSASTAYYYRGYATNATGTAYSADGTFTTPSACAGSIIAGYCWYPAAVKNQTCNTFCSTYSHGACTNATINYNQEVSICNTLWPGAAIGGNSGTITPRRVAGGTCYVQGVPSAPTTNYTKTTCTSANANHISACVCAY